MDWEQWMLEKGIGEEKMSLCVGDLPGNSQEENQRQYALYQTPRDTIFLPVSAVVKIFSMAGSRRLPVVMTELQVAEHCRIFLISQKSGLTAILCFQRPLHFLYLYLLDLAKS